MLKVIRDLDDIKDIVSEASMLIRGSETEGGLAQLTNALLSTSKDLALVTKDASSAAVDLKVEVGRATRTVTDGVREAFEGVKLLIENGKFEESVYETLTHAVNRSALKTLGVAANLAQEDAIVKVKRGMAKFLEENAVAAKNVENEISIKTLEAALKTQREKNVSLNNDVERAKNEASSLRITVDRNAVTMNQFEKTIRERDKTIAEKNGMHYWFSSNFFKVVGSVLQIALMSIIIGAVLSKMS